MDRNKKKLSKQQRYRLKYPTKRTEARRRHRRNQKIRRHAQLAKNVQLRREIEHLQRNQELAVGQNNVHNAARPEGRHARVGIDYNSLSYLDAARISLRN